MKNYFIGYLVVLLTVATTLQGCAGSESQRAKAGEENYDGINVHPRFLGDEYITGAVAGTLGLIQLSGYAPKYSKIQGIHGQCFVSKKEDRSKDSKPTPCSNTFLRVKNLKTGHEMLVWPDENGVFYFGAPNGQSVSLKAENVKTKSTSKELTIVAPSVVKIEIPVG